MFGQNLWLGVERLLYMRWIISNPTWRRELAADNALMMSMMKWILRQNNKISKKKVFTWHVTQRSDVYQLITKNRYLCKHCKVVPKVVLIVVAILLL